MSCKSTATQRARFPGVRSGALFWARGALQPLQAAALECGTVTGTNGAGSYRFPSRSAVEPPRAACGGAPRFSQRAAAAERLRAHQARGDRRPSALPPALLAVHLPAPRPAREARRLRHAPLPPARLRRGARWLGGAAAAPLHLACPAPRRCGSAASSRSWRASAAGRPPCPRRPARPGS